MAQLETLPGIGKSTAERILEYRQKNGGFKRVEDLMNVRGIGEKSFLKMKPLITVVAPKSIATCLPKAGPGRQLCPGSGYCGGYTLIELMVIVGVVTILGGIAAARVLSPVDHSRGYAAARYFAGRLGLARVQAVARGTAIGLRFDQEPRGITFSVFQDGNGNGIRNAEIQAGVDRLLEDSMALSDQFPGADIGLAPNSPATAAVQVGTSNLLTFTPLGTATPGTIHISDRAGTQWAVRVLGATGRTRVLRYDYSTRSWRVAY